MLTFSPSWNTLTNKASHDKKAAIMNLFLPLGGSRTGCKLTNYHHKKLIWRTGKQLLCCGSSRRRVTLSINWSHFPGDLVQYSLSFSLSTNSWRMYPAVSDTILWFPKTVNWICLRVDVTTPASTPQSLSHCGVTAGSPRPEAAIHRTIQPFIDMPFWLLHPVRPLRKSLRD